MIFFRSICKRMCEYIYEREIEKEGEGERREERARVRAETEREKENLLKKDLPILFSVFEWLER